jgi:hypothetical protein
MTKDTDIDQMLLVKLCCPVWVANFARHSHVLTSQNELPPVCYMSVNDDGSFTREMEWTICSLVAAVMINVNWRSWLLVAFTNEGGDSAW